ncbi:hypothetical protein C6503_24905 [Candidatus Poribacteria bacterium]|nr:MAG: hypothetical protein C6503_24905 [Candidatus Poribacteria bacterium]
MEKETLETIAQRLDQLEKTVAELSQKLSSVVEKVATDIPMGPEARAKMRGAEALKNSKREAHITEKILDELFEKLGIPPDFDPGTIEELHESMRQHGIRAEDNEFSRAIIEEREK